MPIHPVDSPTAPDRRRLRAELETMYEDTTLAVVIPAYNEEPFVADVIETVPSIVDRIYAIDDASTDGTWDEIQRAAERVNGEREGGPFERVVVPIQHDENRGVGGAIKTGYLRAREDRIGVTVVMGGDGQMEVEIFTEVVDPIVDGTADYVKTNRFLSTDGIDTMPSHRVVGNRVLDLLTRIASGYWRLGDPQSGYTAISYRALQRIPVEDLYEYYGYCNDVLVKLNEGGLTAVDVPRPVTYGDEESHIVYSEYVPRVSAMLLRNYVARRWRGRPSVLGAGSVALVLGIRGVWDLAGAALGPDPGRAKRGVRTVVLALSAFVLTAAADHWDARNRNAPLDASRYRGSDDD